jgi:cytoskeletal protein CcmA (bactofilin family)
MIFRRENRGESFQRQISNLRQKPQSESPEEEEEQQYDYEAQEYESEEAADTGSFATDQGTPGEGISFPSSRSESTEFAPHETAIGSSQATPDPEPVRQETRQWEPPSPQTTQSGDVTTSMIARNTYWNGTLRSEGSLQVHGKADGELHSETDLYVAEGAEVDASLHADSVVVAGLVRGKIEARSRLEILPQGEVTGDVRSPKLVVHEGATISGQLKMEDVGASPNSGLGGPPARGGSESQERQ